MRSKIEFWRQHVAQLEKSGLTIKEYCKQHKLNFHTFRCWKGNLKHEKSPSAHTTRAIKATSQHTEAPITTPQFTHTPFVKVVPDPAPTEVPFARRSMARLVINSNIVVEFDHETSPVWAGTFINSITRSL